MGKKEDPKTCGNWQCDGDMKYQPRDPLKDTPPRWVCDTCGKIEVIDDDPGTAPMFGDGAD